MGMQIFLHHHIPKGDFPPTSLLLHFEGGAHVSFSLLEKLTRRYLAWHSTSRATPAGPQWLGYTTMQRCIMGHLGQLNQHLQIRRNPPSRPKRYGFDVFHAPYGSPKPGQPYPVLPTTVSSGLCSSRRGECVINSETGPSPWTAHRAALGRET